MQITFQLTELFQIEIDAVIYTDQFICYIGTWTGRLKFVARLNAALGLIYSQSRYLMNCVVYMDRRLFQCAQFLGGLKLLKLGNFLLKMIPVLEGLKPVTKANIPAVQIVVEQDARLSVKDIASCTGISEGSVQTILKKRLDLRKVCARWVPHLLTEEQKTQRLKCGRELLKTYKGYNSRVISNLLTGDETWVLMFEQQRRADNKQWTRKDKKTPMYCQENHKFEKDVVRNFL